MVRRTGRVALEGEHECAKAHHSIPASQEIEERREAEGDVSFDSYPLQFELRRRNKILKKTSDIEHTR